jgi:phosphoribosyl 1,2-cyclic phosphate phosphodiesterase
VYGNRSTIEEMIERFSYAFKETQRGGGKPHLEPIVIDGPISIGGLAVVPVPVKHGGLDILGWRIGETPRGEAAADEKIFLYLTDTSAVPESSKTLTARPDVLIIDGLRESPHETHFSFGQALETALQTGARRTWLTHICHNHLHTEIEKYCADFRKEKNLPEEMTMGPAWDGLEIELSPF